MTDTATRTAHSFRGPGGAGLPNLAGLPGVLRLESALPEVIETERIDTPDHRLAAAGITLELHRAPSTPAQWRLMLPDETLRVPADDSHGQTSPASCMSSSAPPRESGRCARSATSARCARRAGCSARTTGSWPRSSTTR